MRGILTAQSLTLPDNLSFIDPVGGYFDLSQHIIMKQDGTLPAIHVLIATEEGAQQTNPILDNWVPDLWLLPLMNATDVTATTANITWTGIADSFEVGYRKSAVFSENFSYYYTSGWDGYEVSGALLHQNKRSTWQCDFDPDDNYVFSTNIIKGRLYEIDDWFISPKMPLKGVLTFKAHFKPDAETYAEADDMLEVVVYTSDALDPYYDPDYRTVLGNVPPNPSAAVEADVYRFSLDSFNGVEGYVAFRHKCKHHSWADVDDVIVYPVSDQWSTASTVGNHLRLTGLHPDTGYDYRVRAILFGHEYNWLEPQLFTTENFIPLADDADVASHADGRLHDVILQGRTFYRDDDWNTLCLPFALTEEQIAASPLAGATIKEPDGAASGLADLALTLNFKDVSPSGEQGGLIEAGRPYIFKWLDHAHLVISSDADWDAFVQSVAGGETFAGKNVVLSADIVVSAMAGTAEHPFCGTFDGNGHTLCLNINEPGAACAAPFRYVSGATIRNLKTTGSILGGQHCAGIVGAALGGTVCIVNCWMAATVTTSQTHIGGILGHGTTSATTVARCYLSGTLTATNIGVVYGGGDDGGTHTIENCWAMGCYNASVNGGSINLLLADGGTVSIVNCHHLDERISQGTRSTLVIGTWPVISVLGSQWTEEDDHLKLKASDEVVCTDIDSPVFMNVTFSSAAPSPVTFSGGQFVGTYSPVALTPGDQSTLFLGADDALYWPSEANSSDGTFHLNAFRAYFRLAGGATVRAFCLNFGDDDTTGIIPVENGTVMPPAGSEGDVWFTVDGKRLGGMPATKGIYICNGVKVVRK